MSKSTVYNRTKVAKAHKGNTQRANISTNKISLCSSKLNSCLDLRYPNKPTYTNIENITVMILEPNIKLLAKSEEMFFMKDWLDSS